MSDITITKKNESYITLTGESYILQELSDAFTFYAEGYKYSPKYKSRIWDGSIRLLKRTSETKGHIYLGLIDQIISYLKSHGYSITISDDFPREKLNTNDLIEYQKNLKIASKGKVLELRDYQIKGFTDSIQLKRQINLSCTASGKSAIIYSIIRYLIDQKLKCLIIVPSINLLHQLENDFIDYSEVNRWNVKRHTHKIYSGQSKHTDKLLAISTYQSLNLIENEKYFEQFDVVIGDECHNAKCMSLINILSKCINASYRFGFTGTLDNIKANQKTIIGLFGPVNKLNTTKELMNKGQVANFKIKCLVLKYDEETAKAIQKFKYIDEIKFLTANKKRNNLIKNLALSLTNNTIILVNYIEHGKMLYEMLKTSKHIGNRNVYYIYGKVQGEERERIRQIVETEKDAIIIGSSQIMSTGINIKSLHNIILGIAGKSKIRTLQTIGRSLRLFQGKECAVLYDIVDDLSYKKRKNFTLLHFLERIKLYNSEQFDYKIKMIDFNV